MIEMIIIEKNDFYSFEWYSYLHYIIIPILYYTVGDGKIEKGDLLLEFEYYRPVRLARTTIND